MADKTDLIYDSLTDFRKECRDEFKEIKTSIAHNEQETNEKLSGVNQRLSKLEEPRKALVLIKIWAIWVVALAAAINLFKGFNL